MPPIPDWLLLLLLLLGSGLLLWIILLLITFLGLALLPRDANDGFHYDGEPKKKKDKN